MGAINGILMGVYAVVYAPLLVATPQDRFSRVEAQMSLHIFAVL